MPAGCRIELTYCKLEGSILRAHLQVLRGCCGGLQMMPSRFAKLTFTIVILFVWAAIPAFAQRGGGGFHGGGGSGGFHGGGSGGGSHGGGGGAQGGSRGGFQTG